ncbi:MAG: two-component sensor histidine kinase [Phycisphaeraceae bacterium]|nr:two-component sensor histidine kinase [Phycisphaeraceae bacterium]
MALAVIMLMLLGVVTTGWVLLNVFTALDNPQVAGWHWAFLVVGSTFMLLLVVGVVVYMMLSVKAINLSRRQSNFIDSVTHELKSPLASMKLYMQTLDRHDVSREQRETFHRFIREDVDRLDRLINRILDAGRLDSGSIEAETETVALPELLKGCGDSVCLSYRVPLTTIRWEMQPCAVRARLVDLELIFRNLLDNAMKYAGPEPEVHVTLERVGNKTVVARIADNGKGIPPRWRKRIFGRFVRVGDELEREKGGTGLGLYIVETLVRRLRGQIRVQDREGGVGTVFEVRLPADS